MPKFLTHSKRVIYEKRESEYQIMVENVFSVIC